MSQDSRYHYEIDSMDDAGCAVLKREDGMTFPVPVHWLPEAAQPGQSIAFRATDEGSHLTLRLTLEQKDTA